MAEVLSRSHDDQPYYNGSSLKRSGPSRASLLVASPSPAPSARTSSASEPSFEHIERYPRSLPSSASVSSRHSFSDLSQDASYASTPATTLSFESGLDDDHGIAFPTYDEVQFFHEDEPLDLPPSPRPEDDLPSDTASDCSRDCAVSTSTNSTHSDSPLPTPSVADDTAIKQEPSRHVDYLSHDWREEDIWSSWRHIVSQRRVYGQRSRLENASWRTWAKSKYRLATVSPETLNWLKESDVTWLYGPLQPATTHPITYSTHEPSEQLSTSGSFVAAKKPILKKRSMSEVMLQRSLSTSSLVKQAAASVQAQQSIPPRRPASSRAPSDYVSPGGGLTPSGLAVPSNRLDFLDLDYFSPRPASGTETPFDGPKRHIRFDDKVEQCIAVDCKEGDYEDCGSDEDERPGTNESDSDSSEDGIVMMRQPKRKRTARKSLTKTNSASSKTIEKLPDTKLKYKPEDKDTPEQPPTPFTRSWSASKLSPSASQETIRPTKPTKTYLLPQDDEEDEAEAGGWTPGAFASRRDSISAHRARSNDEAVPSSVDADTGLKRTTSGMFMPYEEDEDDVVAAGLFGKVSDTINTAKDIAHVIWNVGWRK